MVQALMISRESGTVLRPLPHPKLDVLFSMHDVFPNFRAVACLTRLYQFWSKLSYVLAV